MAQRLPTRCNPDDRLNQRVLAGTMIKAAFCKQNVDNILRINRFLNALRSATPAKTTVETQPNLATR